MGDELNSVRVLWIVLNAILIVYAIFLFVYGKYFRHKDSLSYVIYKIYNIFFYFVQKSITEDNRGIFSRPDDSLRINENKSNLDIDDKKEHLIET